MADSSLNHYEKRLYSVFKTFDVDNEEALTQGAVLALCDALQLEQRGAGLVEALFERRPADDHPERPDRTEQRVTFAQFRSGLLSVLGEPSTPAPASVTATGPHVAEPAASDEDSLRREVAPKFVFGSKKYGRRSRPSASRGRAPSPSRVASASPPSPPSPPSPELDHSSVVDCERALQLCRRLRMTGIDRGQVQRVFDGLPAAETTVGDFFDRLNVALSAAMGDAGAGAGAGPPDDALAAELVVEAWERAGVARPRRLLAHLGGGGNTVGGGRLARALDDEVAAFGGEGDADARVDLLHAALALAQLRLEREGGIAAAAAGERDRLRADLEEANRRARLLALDVDENHARLEAESAAALRRADARHADALRALEAERAAERERAAAERARLEAEVARRAEAEVAARSELDALRARCEQAEACAARTAEAGAAAERERARAEGALRAAEERAAAAHAALEDERAAGAARAEALRVEAARQRDRADELCAQLEARPPPAHPAPPPPPAPAWLHEARALETESPPVSLEASDGREVKVQTAGGEGKAGAVEGEANACSREECAELRHLVR